MRQGYVSEVMFDQSRRSSETVRDTTEVTINYKKSHMPLQLVKNSMILNDIEAT